MFWFPFFCSCISGRLCDRDVRITICIFLGGFNGGAPPSRNLLFYVWRMSMKIGIISDTHRNIEYLTEAVDWLIDKQKIAMIYHLGDDYDDVKCLADKYIDIVQVPGIYDERYINGELAKTSVENVLGLRILLVHALDKD